MAQQLAHGLKIKKANFKVDTHLKTLTEFKGTILKVNEIKDLNILKNKSIALLGFDAQLLNVFNQALPYARFIKLFCENPSWVLKEKPSFFSVSAPIQSQRFEYLRSKNKSKDFFIISANERSAPYALKKAQKNLKSVKSTWLARQLTPHHLNTEHTFIFNNDFYQNVQKPHVKVITWPIVQILQDGVLTMEGIVHLIDVIIIPE